MQVLPRFASFTHWGLFISDREESLEFSGRIQMFQRKNISALKTPPLEDYDIIIDYSACMVSISLTTHLVDVLNVINQDRKSTRLNSSHS